MSIKLLTPRLGEGVEQVTVLTWLKKVGDLVKEYEPLVEVETDKVVTEVPSPADGVLLQIFILPNTVAEVGQVLAEIGVPGEQSTEALEAPPMISSQPVHTPPPTPVSPNEPDQPQPTERQWISPLVAKMIKEHGLDIQAIQGSGANGRVTKQDVLDRLATAASKPTVESASTSKVAPSQEHELRPLTPIRRRIAERMVQSLHTAPHVLTVMEADLSLVLDHLEKNKAQFAQSGIRLTLTAYFIQAIARALRDNPLVNASWADEGIHIHRQVNIGMAVSLGDEGLIVPVIKNADSLSLLGLARTINDLADRARAGKLQPDEVRGGTFSLTNHGTGASLFAAPIINQPQTGILGTGALQKRPVVITDAAGRDSIAIRPMIYLSFVFDHRVLDGSGADRFLRVIKDFLELSLDH